MRKRLLYYAAGVLIGFVILVILQMPDRHARMIACDVGQGDAVLLTKGSNQVLIDGGPNSEKILSCLARHMPFWDRHIELIVLTNTDFDHMNGLSAVLLRYSTTSFVTADGVHDSEAFARFQDAIALTGIHVRGVEQGETLTVGTRDRLTFTVMWPPQVVDEYIAVFSNQIDESVREQILGASAKRGDLNERSVVIMLTENDYKVLFMGDAGNQAEKDLVTSGLLSDVDVIKVGHHGSKYASSLDFLSVVKPEISVISVGENNRYGHPTREALERLSMVGSVVRRTDVEGDVVVNLSLMK